MDDESLVLIASVRTVQVTLHQPEGGTDFSSRLAIHSEGLRGKEAKTING